MADGQGSVSISPSGSRLVGCPHGCLCFVDSVDVDQVSLIGHEHAGSLLIVGGRAPERMVAADWETEN